MQIPTLGATLAALVLVSSAGADVESDLRTVLNFGPRVTGTAANEQARGYLEAQFRALGYDTRREAFSYPRFDDLGSDLRQGNQTLSGRALEGSTGGEVRARAVRVPGTGTPEDFRAVNVRGLIAVVQRGQLSFLQKAKNAQAAGAAGLIIINSEAKELQGRFGERLALPALAVTSTTGAALRDGQEIQLRVRVRDGEVRGVNVVAFKSGVSRPEVLFGAHMDSVFRAPGANDNLSGTVAVMELARRTVNTPLAARSYFVLFDGEEDGLRGSRAFVKDHPALVQGLRTMFNFDMVGVNVSPLNVTGERLLVETAKQVAGLPGSFPAEGGSDQVPFDQAGVPTLFFHRGLDANYHQPGDVLADPALIRATVDAALGIVDVVLKTPVPAGR
ncbi:M28 family peptidase [Deinococcus navajonensis]|uniref:M28 family peptidase n=1 Tax=Deinococcus navajonensis TaxID=309884 RepID=A0ABV8XMR1_9DEIO